MRIAGYRTLTTVHDWGRPIGDANGAVGSGKTSVPIVVLTTDVGLEGIGLGSQEDIDTLFPALDGQDPRAVVALYDRMLARVFKRGHAGSVFGAIGALDMALWDLKAKAVEQPLWRLLGARDHVVPAYASGLDGPLADDELIRLHKQFAERGLQAAKLKGGLDVAADLRRLDVLSELYRDETGQAPALMLDANETWSRKEAVRHIRRIEEHVDLAWVEEPVRRWDVDGLGMVTRSVQAAVATGENLTGLEQFRPLLAANAVDIVQTGSVWGITHFLRVSALAHAFDLPISPVGYDGNPLGHAAAVVPNHLSIEIQDLGMPIGISADQEVADGHLVLGESPGLGYTLDEGAVARLGEAGSWDDDTGPHVRPDRAGRRLVSKPRITRS
ncbi:L-alanine-DL-glutamate epimerase-like enolase superfamily enzyme [Kribbella sp. VKM Ac-2571]|uniref:mandelate racemase/muconate lactonizing enzyme family protein n=1 Tax=Kribbella sp. VKM Ac-2571 TaxID=2512222 RepID=UPI0010609633|nr:mandelate racemase/muconate lactonizing enzyme family protein [Kribbella sp. VKM Ac-2571]TDO56756.1 L-alanine-DL-glutamate epimerase-like enolase superfamily enzyme [Kribbella sp. VKM Ac-2571]